LGYIFEMSTLDFLKRFKFARKRTAPSFERFDRRLVGRLRGRGIPQLRQLKYLGHFLSTREKQLLWGGLTVAVVGFLGWSTLFVAHHSMTAPTFGGDYTEAVVGQPLYLNPLFASLNDTDADLSSLIYTGLFTHDGTGEIVPSLASGFNRSDDGKIYTITVRDDAKWSDGEPVTPQDIAFTVGLIQNPEVGSPLAPAFQGVKTEVVDNHTVRFTLPQPYAFFLSTLTVGILPEHLWGDLTPANVRLAKLNVQPVGAGAWAVQKLVKNEDGTIQSYTLRPNEQYFGIRPYLNSLTFKFVGDYVQALEALRNQTVTAVSFPPEASTKKLGSKSITTYAISLPQYTALFFNPVKNGSLKNDDLRSALTLAIDTNQLVAQSLQGAAAPVSGPLPSVFGEFRAPSTTAVSDPGAANVLLEKTWKRIEPEQYFKLRQAEFAKIASSSDSTSSSTPDVATSTNRDDESIRAEMAQNQSFYRVDKDNHPLALTITTVDIPEYHAVADFLAASWRAIGVKTQVRFVGARQMTREVLKPRDYDVLLYGEIMGGDPDLFPFWHSSQSDFPGANLARYNNRDADTLLDQARLTLSEADRADLYAKFNTLLTKDKPAIFLYTPQYAFLAQNDLRGIHLGALLTPSERYRQINQWYLKTHWTWRP
jgi:peptide/nickel transport system substrate-binding protein